MINNAGKDESEKQKDKNKLEAGITDEKAFDVGIDWFTEIVFFYGILFGLCYYEFKKFAASQRNINLRIKNLEGNSEKILETITLVKDRQTMTRSDMEKVLDEIEKIATDVTKSDSKL